MGGSNQTTSNSLMSDAEKSNMMIYGMQAGNKWLNEAGNSKSTYDTGLYGTSTADKNGVTWTPTSFQTQLVNYAQDNIPSLLNQYMTPTTDSAWYQANKAIRQQAQNDAFENQVINPLASRNLTRGSSVNALSNMFANDVARQEQQALLDESNRAGELANTLLGYYQTPYNMMTSANQIAQQNVNAQNALALDKANFELNKYNALAGNYLDYSRPQVTQQSGSNTLAGIGTGALSGAASGAAIGSVIPGIGTAIGAGVGAVGGGLAGGLSSL